MPPPPKKKGSLSSHHQQQPKVKKFTSAAEIATAVPRYDDDTTDEGSSKKYNNKKKTKAQPPPPPSPHQMSSESLQLYDSFANEDVASVTSYTYSYASASRGGGRPRRRSLANTNPNREYIPIIPRKKFRKNSMDNTTLPSQEDDGDDYEEAVVVPLNKPEQSKQIPSTIKFGDKSSLSTSSARNKGTSPRRSLDMGSEEQAVSNRTVKQSNSYNNNNNNNNNYNNSNSAGNMSFQSKQSHGTVSTAGRKWIIHDSVAKAAAMERLERTSHHTHRSFHTSHHHAAAAAAAAAAGKDNNAVDEEQAIPQNMDDIMMMMREEQTKCEIFCDWFGWVFLCCGIIAFWAGVIPWLVVHNNQNSDYVFGVVSTTPPLMNSGGMVLDNNTTASTSSMTPTTNPATADSVLDGLLSEDDEGNNNNNGDTAANNQISIPGAPADLFGPAPTAPATPEPTSITPGSPPSSSSSSSSAQQSQPTPPPTFAPTTSDVAFANYTTVAFANPSSPQSKAFAWMIRDSNFPNYFPDQIRQRFALACLYYSTNGEEWVFSSNNNGDIVDSDGTATPYNWLSYEGHECDWPTTTTYASTTLSATATPPHCTQVQRPDGSTFLEIHTLHLDNANLRGSLPPEVSMLTGLQDLNVGNNELFGTLPPSWFWDDKQTPETWRDSLRRLNLEKNDLSGSLPTEIGLLSNLEDMQVQFNRFIHTIPSEIGGLTNLQHLIGNDNVFTGSLPTTIGNLQALQAVSWSNNQLIGAIPSEIGLLINLEEFYVGRNRLSGSLPTEMGNLAQLLDWHAYNNALVGSIPSQIGMLNELRWLHLAFNQLTGMIPGEIGNCEPLQLLQVEGNQLSGEIPTSSFEQLEKVSRVWLYDNAALSGTIPLEWCGGVFQNRSKEEEMVDPPTRVVEVRVDCDEQVTCPCGEGCSCQ